MLRGQPHAHWEGRRVVARDGEAIGSVLRAHGDGGWPDALVVDLGPHKLAVPAEKTVLSREEVHLPWPARRLREARPLDAEAHKDAAAVARFADAFEHPGHTPISDDENAMTLSEERLDISVRASPIERIALRKRLVEEVVSVPVTVRREVVEMVREPVTAGDEDGTAVTSVMGEPAAPAEVAEGIAAEIVLYEERPVVGVEVVPRERIRLVKSFVTEEVEVTGEVRREEATVDRLPPDLPTGA